MRILMVGAGATGGYFGGRMALAGRDVTFLVRGQRKEQLQRDGIRIAGPSGDATLSQPKLITAEELKSAGAFDVVIISVKAYSLESAMNDFAAAVGDNTVIVPILNGMRHLDTLAHRFGKEKVMGGSVRIVCDVEPDGLIRQMTKLDHMNFGEIDGTVTTRAQALYDAFSVPGITLVLSKDIIDTMWQKWWILSTMGAVCVLGGGNVGEIVATGEHGVAMALAVQDEAIAIATANGHPADAEFVKGHGQRMTEAGSTLTSSMYRDMTKGLPVEADHILGDLLARANGVKAPLLGAAYTHLKVYEGRRG
ncbi:ketopantoate reductase family protein [Terriglobus sp. TAA 43]|uniref:ketopantoate reductase family protein n=1 Tax=Terriglobus sp. TAA 43 TaxID=278961 RepID=UPI000648A610|nr:ketopantoate reductase family protein [Terriglobus sp. TAA 43]